MKDLIKIKLINLNIMNSFVNKINYYLKINIKIFNIRHNLFLLNN